MRYLIRLFPALAFALVLTACASFGPAKIELAGCETYASTLDELAKLRADGKLSATQIDYVDKARPGLNEICESPPPDIDAKAMNIALDAGVKALASIVAIVKGN